jgi:hypothetical protein
MVDEKESSRYITRRYLQSKYSFLKLSDQRRNFNVKKIYSKRI